ncbi:hypothetical protein V5799_015985 [Amblyomma americanum]|uniref:Uncharacterized protein n=1 Tax=Amblyomma americanum TaxID=6943 RepID=A0AAQ4F7F9_AMBAM
MIPQRTVKLKPAVLVAFREDCVYVEPSHGVLPAEAWRHAGAQDLDGRRRAPALLESADKCPTSTAPRSSRAEQHHLWWLQRYLIASCGCLPNDQRLDAYDGTCALHAKVIDVSLLSGARNVPLFSWTLKCRRESAQKNGLVSMVNQIELPFPEDKQERTGQHEHQVKIGADEWYHVVFVNTRRLAMPVGCALYRRRIEGGHIERLILDHAVSRLTRIATNHVLEAPGAFASSGFSIRDTGQLAVLLEHLAQDAAGVIWPWTNPVKRIPAVLTPPCLHTTESAEELAILPRDLAQDAAGVFRPEATLMVRLLPLRRLPCLTSEKTRKNLSTSCWPSAGLPLVSQAF